MRIKKDIEIPRKYAIALSKNYEESWGIEDYSHETSDIVEFFRNLLADKNTSTVNKIKRVRDEKVLEMRYKALLKKVLGELGKNDNITSIEIEPTVDSYMLMTGIWVFVAKPCRIEIIREGENGKKSKLKQFGVIVYVLSKDEKKLKDVILLPLLPIGKGVSPRLVLNNLGIKVESCLDIIPVLRLSSVWFEKTKALIDLYGDNVIYPTRMGFPFISVQFPVGVVTINEGTLSTGVPVVGYKVLTEKRVSFIEGGLKVSGLRLKTIHSGLSKIITVLPNGKSFEFDYVHTDVAPEPIINVVKTLLSRDKIDKFFVRKKDDASTRVYEKPTRCSLQLSSSNSSGSICFNLTKPLVRYRRDEIPNLIKVLSLETNVVNVFHVERGEILVVPLSVKKNEEGYDVNFYVIVTRLMVDTNGYEFWEVSYKLGRRRFTKVSKPVF